MSGRHDSSNSQLPGMGRQRSIIIDGALIPATQAAGICKKRGLCRFCGETKTHLRKRVGLSVKMEPLTTMDNQGDYTVYKGYCIKPLCYTLEQAKQELGESTARPSMAHGKSKRKKKEKRTTMAESNIITAEVSVVSSEKKEDRSVVSNSSGSNNSASLPPPSPKRLDASTSEEFTFYPQRQLHRNSGSGRSGYIPEEPRESSSRSTHHRRSVSSEEMLRHSRVSPVSKGSISADSRRHVSRTSFENIPFAPNLHEESVAIRELEGFIHEQRYREFVDTLCSNENIANVVKKAFQLLRNNVHMAHHTCGYVFASPSWVKYCVSAMQKNSKDQSVQIEGVLMLWTLAAVDPSYMKEITKDSGVNAVLDVMDKYKNDEQVVETCCGALECFTSNSEEGISMKHNTAKKTITRLVGAISIEDDDVRAITRLVGAISIEDDDVRHEANFDVVREDSGGAAKVLALRALYNLSLQEDEMLMDIIQDALPNSQGLVAITSIIKNEDKNTDRVEWAIRLLLSLAASSSARSISASSFALIEAVMAALGNSNSPSFQEAACGLLSTLASTCNDDDVASSENTRKIAEAIVVSATSHPSVKCIQLSSMQVLGDVCSSPENLALIAEMDVVSIAIDAMNSYRDDAEVQGAACMLLAYLCANETTKAAIATTDGINAVVTAFSTHVVDSDLASSSSESIEMIREGACTTLASLAMSPQAADTLTRSGILEDIDLVLLNGRNAAMPPCIRAVVINMLVAKSQVVEEGAEIDHSTAILAMKALKSVETVDEAETLMTAIHSVTCTSPQTFDHVLSVNNGDGMDILMHSIGSFSQSELVQQSGCAILANLYIKIPYSGSLNQRTRLTAGSKSFEIVTHTEKEVKLLLSAMTKHKNKARVQEYACSALCNFIAGSYGDVVPTDIETPDEVIAAFSGTIKKVVDALSIHEASLDVQKNACRLLWVMAFLNDEMEMKRWSLHGITKVFEAMARFREDEELNLIGCGILLIMIKDEDSAQFMGNNDGIRALIHCLRFQNEGIVESASELLAIIMRTVFQASNEFIMIEDSVEAVILCMDEHSLSASIQIELCSMLASLVSLQDSFVKGMIGNNGGLNAIIVAMRNHRDDEMVVECGCRALSGIVGGCTPELIRRETQTLGDILMSSLADHPDNEVVQNAVLEALWCLCARQEIFNDYITGTNGLPIIIDSMCQHVMSEEVIQSGCSLLWMMSTHGDNKKSIGRAGVRAVVNGMQAHITSSAVQKEALTALKNLSTFHDNKSATIDLGGVQAIVQSMWVHMESPQIFCAACSALNNVAVDSVSKRVSKIENGELPAICFGMKKHAHSNEVQKCACFLLKSYTFAPSNLPILRSEDPLVGLLTAAAESFPEDCADRAKYVLGQIA